MAAGNMWDFLTSTSVFRDGQQPYIHTCQSYIHTTLELDRRGME